MDYLAYLFFNHLNCVTTEIRHVDGEEQVCLVIPTKTNQIKRGKRGNWLMILNLREMDPNPDMISHRMSLFYLTKEAHQRDKALGRHRQTQRMGRVYVRDDTPSKKLDRTNRATDIICEGIIMLSNIPETSMSFNNQDKKRYLPNTVFKPYGDDSAVYTGMIGVDDIPKEYIQTDSNTGKKYVKCRFCKLEILDTYMNTHHLVIKAQDGSEIEIGRFKEWSKTDSNPSAPNPTPPEEHTTTVNQRQTPQSIDGIKF